MQLSKAGPFLTTPAIHGKLVRVPLYSFNNSRLDLDGPASHITAIQLGHGPLSLFLRLEVDKTIGRVPASERVKGNVDALAIQSFSRRQCSSASTLAYMENPAAVNRASTSSVFAVYGMLPT